MGDILLEEACGGLYHVSFPEMGKSMMIIYVFLDVRAYALVSDTLQKETISKKVGNLKNNREF